MTIISLQFYINSSALQKCKETTPSEKKLINAYSHNNNKATSTSDVVEMSDSQNTTAYTKCVLTSPST
jgi:hypothetical protein